MSPFKCFLTPFAWVWDALHSIRRFLYRYHFFKVHSFQVPIISVGNLTFGGTGKTPFTAWLTQFCEAQKYTPLILSRGYKGQLEKKSGLLRPVGPNVSGQALLYGDEPMLLIRKMTTGAIAVGRNRAQNLTHYFPSILPDVVILDDGHQHLGLDRRLNIVLFDALTPLEDYRVFPRGRLRESFRALKCADIICLTRARQVSQEQKEQFWNFIAPHLGENILKGEIDYSAKSLTNGHFHEVLSLAALKGKEVMALTALASPKSFWMLLESLGVTIIEKIVFPDHYDYRLHDIMPILERAIQRGAFIVTTEKDMVKLQDLVVDNHLLCVEIELDWVSGQESIENKIKEIIRHPS